MTVVKQVKHDHAGIGTLGPQALKRRDGLTRGTAHHRLEQTDCLAAVGQTQHVAHVGGGHRRARIALNQRLVKQG